MTDLALLNNNTLYSKSEKIVSALFLVSNTMTDAQELKTKIRNLGLELLSLCISIKDNTDLRRYNLLKALEKSILELTSILNIASISGLISEMNASILKGEFEVFLKAVSEFSKSIESRKFSISKDFFEEVDMSQTPIKDEQIRHLSTHSSNVLKTSEKDKISRKNQRSRDILTVISKKGDVSIKDIVSIIKGCSEKTVQRELNTLIEKGQVKKAGERRWSRYSLA
jgi:hypothetical protein